MRVEPQQRNAHPTEDHNGSMNLPTSVEERIKRLAFPFSLLQMRLRAIGGYRLRRLPTRIRAAADATVITRARPVDENSGTTIGQVATPFS